MNLAHVLYRHIPCPILAHFTIVRIGTGFLSGLRNELQGSHSFFNWSVTVSDFQVRSLHQLDFFCWRWLFLFPFAAAGILVHVEIASSFTSLQAPMQVHIEEPSLHPGRKGFYRLPSLLAGREWLPGPVLLERGTPPSHRRLYSVVTACDTFSNGPPSGCSCD